MRISISYARLEKDYTPTTSGERVWAATEKHFLLLKPSPSVGDDTSLEIVGARCGVAVEFTGQEYLNHKDPAEAPDNRHPTLNQEHCPKG